MNIWDVTISKPSLGKVHREQPGAVPAPLLWVASEGARGL